MSTDAGQNPHRRRRINLTARQYEVGIAADGLEAPDSAARRVPDLVLPDLGLGQMGGIEAVTSLRAAFDAGADDYLSKPFAMEERSARIRALLCRAEQRRQGELAVVVGNHVVDMIAKTVVRPRIPGLGGLSGRPRTVIDARLVRRLP